VRGLSPFKFIALESEQMDEQELLTVPQFARKAQASLAWAYSKVKSGEIESVRLPGGRLLRVPVSELKKLRPLTRLVAEATAG
jgi:hypothetical protein